MNMSSSSPPRLPCKVDRLEGFVILWKKDTNIVTVGAQIIDKVQHMSLLFMCDWVPSDKSNFT
jgi:hypothetical protein